MARKSFDRTNPDSTWILHQLALHDLSRDAFSVLLFGIADKSRVSRLLSGERDLRAEEATIMANKFQVSVDEVYKRFDLPTPKLPGGTVRVVGTIKADRSIHLLAGGTIPPLAKTPSNTVAVRQTSEGTYKGWCFYFVPTDAIAPEAINNNSVVSRDGHPDVVCVLRRSRKKDRYVLQIEKATGTEVVEDVEVTAATPVLGGILA